MRNKVHLITYADRLAGDLSGLTRVLSGELVGLFGGVHVLPFYTPFDGADAGFDPDDHTAVDPRLGGWDDIAALGTDLDVTADVVVSHVSTRSRQMTDWVARGSHSAYSDMVLTMSSVFPDGATEAELLRLERRRAGLPFTSVTTADGRRLIWTTFGPEQVDIDVRSDSGRAYLLGVLDRLADAGVASVRLDGVGYAVKTAGTSSFMTRETFAFIDELTTWCHDRGLEVLVEARSYYRRQVEIARQVDLVYDLALPALVLHGLTTGDAEPLSTWLRVRPRNAVTVLDTHDGIGVVDVGDDPEDQSRAGLLSRGQVHELVETIHKNSGGTSRPATREIAANADLSQVNCTFFDALGRDDEAYLLARAIQFFTPGIPHVYYVGLLAGTNDIDQLARTHVGRDVNRHAYSPAEIHDELGRPVVDALVRLIRFRNWHPAFDGEMTVLVEQDDMVMTWREGPESARLATNLGTRTATLTWTQDGAPCSVAHLRDIPDMREEP